MHECRREVTEDMTVRPGQPLEAKQEESVSERRQKRTLTGHFDTDDS